MSAPHLYAVLPDRVTDPSRPSGGSVYDLRVCAALESTGRAVDRILVPGAWPTPSAPDLAGLGAALTALPDGATVLLDGLVACAAPDVVVPATARLRTVVLVHLPLADETGPVPGEAARREACERDVLRASAHVVATSRAVADRLRRRHGLSPDRVHVARPGVDPAPVTAPSDDGTRLLSVASLTPRKGHDVLVEALARVADLRWECAFAGAEPDDAHAAAVRRLVRARGLGHRVEFTGPLSPGELSARYARTDLLVLASRAEPYGMVVTEALARGIPALVTAVDGLPEALRGDDGPTPGLPGLLVPPDDANALATGIRAWLTDPAVRARRRRAAGTRRTFLRPWEATATALAAVLDRPPQHHRPRRTR
ncbi:MAG: glycosyltransferase family 4 protein [Actinomycetota bacterium]|nr:glycosyltransferase family 4 protein [Actinomycetota bacterium]